MFFHIRHQIQQAFALGIAGAPIMHIAERALKGVGPGTGGRPKQSRNARVGSQPWLDSLGCMDLRVIHDDIEPRIRLGRIACIERLERITKEGVGCARPQTVGSRPRGQVERPSQGVLLGLARCHDGQWGALWHPGTADCRHEVEV